MTFNISRTRRAAAAESSGNSQTPRSESPAPAEHVPRTARQTPLAALLSRRQSRESVADAADRRSVRIGSAANATRSGTNAGNTSPARARGRSSSPPVNPSAAAGGTPAGSLGRRGQGFTGAYSSMDRAALHRFTYDQQHIATQQTEQTRQRVRELNEFMASVRVASSQESAGTHNPPDHNALGIPTADQQRMATQQRVQEWNAFMESMRANESSRALSQEATGTHNSTDRNALGIPTDDQQRIATQQRVRELNEFMAFVRTNESSRVPRQEPTGLPELTGRNTFHTPASDHQDIERGFASRQRMQELPDRTRFARTNESSRVPSQEPTGPSESTSGNTLDTPIGAGDRRDIAQGRANRQRVQELLDLTYLARANDPSGMPNQQALTDAVDMLIGMHDTDLTDLVGRNGFYVIEHLRDIGVLPSYQLAAPVQQAARNAHNDPEQLVRNLLALVTADPPLLPVRHRSSSPSADRPAEAGGTSAGPSGMPSQAVLTDAVGMLMGLHDVDLRDLAGSNALNVIEHLHDIQRLPSDRLAPRVRQAARDARNDPQQLVLSLLALVTADSPLLPARPRSTSSPVNRPAETGGTPAGPLGMPSQAVLTDAVGMLMGLHDVDLRDLAGSNALNVIEHLHDIQRLPSGRLAPRVRQAARDARNDPQQLVLSLLALVTADSPLLPARPRSTSSPVNRPAEAGGTSAGPLGMPSRELLNDAVGRLTILRDRVARRPDRPSEQLNMIGLVIEHLRSDQLAPFVQQAAREANNDSHQLVRYLLRWVTEDPSLLLPAHRPAEAGGTSAGSSGMPSREVLTDAVGMLMDLHEVDLRDLAGPNGLNVIEHLHDIQRLPSDRLAPSVRQAALDAHNDAEQLVRNLLALVTADSPLLPARPRSSS